jgi:hypothetical protein
LWYGCDAAWELPGWAAIVAVDVGEVPEVVMG